MRTFAAGFNAILSGGACYWLAIIRPNASDTWTAMAFGSIPTYSLSGYDVKTGRLVDISDIQQEIDIYDDTFAKTPSVDIDIYNSDSVISQEQIIGRQIEIRMGYGATMSIATSEVFFTGKIKEVDKNDLHRIKLLRICGGLASWIRSFIQGRVRLPKPFSSGSELIFSFSRKFRL